MRAKEVVAVAVGLAAGYAVGRLAGRRAASDELRAAVWPDAGEAYRWPVGAGGHALVLAGAALGNTAGDSS